MGKNLDLAARLLYDMRDGGGPIIIGNLVKREGTDQIDESGTRPVVQQPDVMPVLLKDRDKMALNGGGRIGQCGDA